MCFAHTGQSQAQGAHSPTSDSQQSASPSCDEDPAGGEASSLAGQVPPDSAYQLQLCHTLDVPGVFDMKWAPGGVQVGQAASDGCQSSTGPLLGAALADGSLRLLQLTGSTCTPSSSSCCGSSTSCAAALQQVASCVACSDDAMCLSLGWQQAGSSTADDAQPSDTSSSTRRLVTSSSAGTASLLHVHEAGLSLVHEWKAHELECWCAAFSGYEVSPNDLCFSNLRIKGPKLLHAN